jgi:hypothetical protein
MLLCSVEIVDPMVFTPVNTYPVLQKDKVFWEWESLLRGETPIPRTLCLFGEQDKYSPA